MSQKIALITILTDNFQELFAFYSGVLGFIPKTDMEQYAEFESDGVRFALCDREVMYDATGDESYTIPAKGHAFELAFPVNTPTDVDTEYGNLISKGARGIKEPADMPWGQRTTFFADPDGNIHEIFADIE